MRVPISMKAGRPARFDYEYERNGADWQFTTKNARIKLKHLYPALGVVGIAVVLPGRIC